MADDTTPTLEALADEEAATVFAEFDEAVAFELGTRAVEEARRRELPIVVGIWRGQHQLFHAALPGSTQDNDEWLLRKGRVVTRFERSSLYVARLCKDQGVTLADRFHLPAADFAATGGAVPIRVQGAGVVGWMGASGLPNVEDHRFVMGILRGHLDGLAKG